MCLLYLDTYNVLVCAENDFRKNLKIRKISIFQKNHKKSVIRKMSSV